MYGSWVRVPSGSPRSRCKMLSIRSDFFCAWCEGLGGLLLAVSGVRMRDKLWFLIANCAGKKCTADLEQASIALGSHIWGLQVRLSFGKYMLRCWRRLSSERWEGFGYKKRGCNFKIAPSYVELKHGYIIAFLLRHWFYLRCRAKPHAVYSCHFH